MENNCNNCPRNCNVDRIKMLGFCKAPIDTVVNSAIVHMGEETIISGRNGSGTVFFSGCNLGCVFCQNHDISQNCTGTVVSVSQLYEIFIKLEKRGVHNINLVTPSHFVGNIAEAIKHSKKKGFELPFVYNSNGYDAVPSLEMMDGLIDIYMPDFKYADNNLGESYSKVPDYFTIAQSALLEMYRQVGDPVIKNGIMQKGVLIRHLVMPGLTNDSLRVLDWIKANVPTALINIMGQYRPEYLASKYKEINCCPAIDEIQTVKAYLKSLELINC